MKEMEVIYEYYLNPERVSMFGMEVRRAMDEFMGSQGPVPAKAFPHFFDWFIFDFALSDGTTPIRRFSQTNLLQLSPDERAVYTEIAEHNAFDFFAVSEPKKQSAVFTGLRDNTRYDVSFPGSGKMEDGEVVVCRIARIRGKWNIVSMDPIGMPSPSARDKRKMKTEFPEFDSRVVYHEIIAMENVMEEPRQVNVSADDLENGMSLITVGDDTKDDGCPVCVAARAAKSEGRAPTEAEVKRAFREANDQQHKPGKNKQ